jgi:Flp pilus assembly protein TadD
MVALIVGMLLCVVLALAVVGLVAVPARRQGRQLLTPRGEEVMSQARERTQDALDKTGEVLSATKDKVTESVATSTPKTAEPGSAPAAPPAGGDGNAVRRAS